MFQVNFIKDGMNIWSYCKEATIKGILTNGYLKWNGQVVDQLDTIYAYLRKNIAKNFPVEELERARKFGAGIDTAFNEELTAHIIEKGGKSIKQMLELNNSQIAEFYLA